MRHDTFNVDKSELLRKVLDKLQVRYGQKTGWQQVHCPHTLAHAQGDRNPSCAVHLGYGKIHCHACGLHGDAFDLAHEVLGLSPKDTLKFVNTKPGEQESEWLI